MRMLSMRLPLLVLVCLSASCASAAQNKPVGKSGAPVITVPKVKGGEPAPDEPPPRAVDVLWAEKTPEKPVIDGDLADWVDFAPSEGSAPSRVVFALTKTAAFIVVDLAEAAKDGIWIGISSDPAELPALGYMQRDGTFIPLDCKSQDAEWIEKCRNIEARRDGFVEVYKSRFERFYRLDGKAIRELGMNGLEAVPNAAFASKPSPKGQTIEVKLPLLALPRMSFASVGSVRLYASPGPETKAPSPKPEERVEISAPEPVTFEPLGELRERAQISALRAGFSYQPGEANKIEVFRVPELFERYDLEPREVVLWEPATSLGDIAVGYLRTTSAELVIYKAAKLLDTEYLSGEPKGFAHRNKKIHVFSWDDESIDGQGVQMGRWSVVAVGADGKTEEICEDDDVYGWNYVESFHADDFSSFGVRGQPWSSEGGDPARPVEIVWKLDKKTGKYLPKSRTLPGKK